MNRIDFARTPKYLVDNVKFDYYKKEVVFKIEVESFRTKRSIKNEEIIVFINALDHFMTQKNIRTNPNKVCLVVNIFVHQKSAPSIQNIPKAYIDLLQKLDTRNGNKSRKERSFFTDDENISILKVNYRRSKNRKNEIEFKLLPFSVVRKGINVLYRLDKGYYETLDLDYDVIDKREDDGGYNIAENYIIEDEFRDLDVKEKNNSLALSDQIWFAYCKRVLQTEFYGNQSRESYFPINVFFDRINSYGYSDLKKEIKKMRAIPTKYDSILAKLPALSKIEECNFQVKLPENPQESGQSSRLKDELKMQLTEIIKKRPFLSPTFVPLSLLIVVLPGKNQDVDVDNLARKYIIPSIENAFSPPSDYLSQVKDDDLRYELMKAGLSKNIKIEYSDRKYFPNNSLSSYECIKLDRLSDDEVGFINVGIYSSESHRGFVDRLFDRLYDYDFD